MIRSSVFKKLSALTFLSCAIITSGHAVAGSKVTQTVTANPTYIFGNLADARNSADTMQMLEILDYGTYVYISGVMISGSMAGCMTTNAVAMEQLRNARSDSQVRANISSGTCNNVYVANSSRHAPKNP